VVGFPELAYGGCAALLVAYLAGWPAGAAGPTGGERLRFLVVGAAVAFVALTVAGWPLPTAGFLGLSGAGAALAVALVVDRGTRTMAPPKAAAAPVMGLLPENVAPPHGVELPPSDPPAVDAFGADGFGAELFDESSRTSDRITAPDVVVHECPRCRTTNKPDARFCKACSAPLVPWTCEACGRMNDVDATFCEGCREPVPLLASPFDSVPIPADDDAGGDPGSDDVEAEAEDDDDDAVAAAPRGAGAKDPEPRTREDDTERDLEAG